MNRKKCHNVKQKQITLSIDYRAMVHVLDTPFIKVNVCIKLFYYTHHQRQSYSRTTNSHEKAKGPINL